MIAAVRAGLAPAAVAAPVAARLEEFDPLPQYKFGYNVADDLTGDYKSQQESRDGDVVSGRYSLVEADGTRRIVDYSADPINGFNAVVRNEPLVAAAPAVVAEPAVIPARVAAAPAVEPVAKFTAAYTSPLTYSAPVAKFAAYTAPVVSAYPVKVAAYSAPLAPVARLTAAPFAYKYAASPIISV